MANDRNAFKAGLFIVISIVLIIGVVVAIKGVGQILEPRQVRSVTFKLTDDIGGLRVGDDVRVGGMKVGIIRSIRVDTAPPEPDAQPRIVITFQLPERIHIREGARIGVQGTLTGSSWLNFDNIGQGAEMPLDVALVGRASAMSALTASLGEAGPEISGLVRDVRAKTVPKVNDAVDKTKEAMAQAGGLLGDVKSDVRGTIANLNSATGNVKEKLPGLLDRFDEVAKKVSSTLDTAGATLTDVKEMTADAKQSMGDVKQTMANAREISASGRSIVQSNRGKIDAMIGAIKTAGDNLKSATAEIRRSPWRLLYKPGKGEMANLNLYDSARQFADGANSLSDAATALRDALKDPTADPARLQQLVEKLDETFGQFGEVESKLWKQVQE